MNEVGDETLAGTCLALDEHGRQTLERNCRTREQAIQLVAQGGDRGASAEQLL
jgi:hypothetical protein